MISKESDPVAWAMLLYELDDAKEHLEGLISDLMKNPNFDETDFSIQLRHVFSHLNRAWNHRDLPENYSEEQWLAASQLPIDFKPL
jgi:hypothetical protein